MLCTTFVTPGAVQMRKDSVEKKKDSVKLSIFCLAHAVIFGERIDLLEYDTPAETKT